MLKVVCQGLIKFVIPEFLPEPGIPSLEVGVEANVLLEVILHVVLGRKLPKDHDDHSLGLVLERLLVRGPKLQLGPHGVYVGLAEDDDGPPAGLHAVDDLVWDHLAHAPVPGVNQTFELVPGVLRLLQAGQQAGLHVLAVRLRVRDECVVGLLLVDKILGEKLSSNRLGVQPNDHYFSLTEQEAAESHTDHHDD